MRSRAVSGGCAAAGLAGAVAEAAVAAFIWRLPWVGGRVPDHRRRAHGTNRHCPLISYGYEKIGIDY
ncbi:protein of unknown function [Burkholderia multivorans]